ncbi:endo-1,3-alpha-glucanase family glycosylhydrolase [Streptomyces sp. TLI_185]|uniref:endo-1,3-alpha-glucanase family glycosylhydrolase n=1 Tax=Streptomyces sp. TLI_185 TaxID=2485151 RepID=UPI000F5018DE|nr:endo-1,3-alpha-glucanase family glycosylhydrolase [Streptomyces sp. TLI_185]RPF37649.1 glycosyl hydrolase family 99 [Streptomyces sp. TLI_185]
MRRSGLLAVLVLVLAGLFPASASSAEGHRAPLLAYYYQWFEPSSWQRAKTDYPRLGHYSSDDASVIRTHVDWAKSAGIDGFVVSWKSSAVNNRRLRLLLDVARARDFKVAVIYQGLDFHRRPLTTDRVAADFRLLYGSYARDPVFFRLDGKPLTVFSGTWQYSTADIARITGPVRKGMLVLATEKNAQGIRRLAHVTDGDAYYWSSVNPDTNDRHETKLREMAATAHAAHGYWMAPFAPGFDARMVGGTKSVPRDGGRTLRTEYAAAMASGPDVLGLISWNEFSENSHVEPSERQGSQSMDVLRELRGLPASATPSAPSSSAARHDPLGYWPGLLRITGCAVLLVAAVAALAWQRVIRMRKAGRT